MASNYPTSIDSFTDPLSNSPLNNPSHAAQHQDVNDAVEKLETKLGVGSSPASGAASGHVLVANGSGSTTWQAPAVTAAQFATTGLRLIETRDVTAVATMDFISVFSTDYRGYLIEWNYTQNTSTGDLYMQFRDASGVIASNYLWGWGGAYVSGIGTNFAAFSYQTTVATSCFIGSGATATNKTSGRLELWNPQDSGIVYGAGQAVSFNYSASLTQVHLSGGVIHNATATRTGFRLLTNAGTVTGKFSLYGFRN